jgi:L-threonylcarbamoyladenylate synthase
VVPQTDRLPAGLVTVAGTVGIRIPAPAVTRQVVAAFGRPVTATSLNRSGEETRPVDRAVLDSFDWQGLPSVPVVVDDAAVVHTLPSTLVRLTGPHAEILRPGPITAEDIRLALAGQPRTTRV